MAHNFGRLSPIFTNNTDQWPWPVMANSPPRDDHVDEEMDIDPDDMTLSQQCLRFEREMIWSPIPDASQNSCEMLSQVETEKVLPGECVLQASPDMFADSQDSSDVVMHNPINPVVAPDYRHYNMFPVSMECSQSRPSIGMNSIDSVESARHTPGYTRELVECIRRNMKIMEHTQPHASIGNSMRMSSTPIVGNTQECIEYEAEPTNEEILTFRQKLGMYGSQHHTSPMEKRKFIKARRSKSSEAKHIPSEANLLDTSIERQHKLNALRSKSFTANVLRELSQNKSKVEIQSDRRRPILKARRSKSTEPRAPEECIVIDSSPEPIPFSRSQRTVCPLDTQDRIKSPEPRAIINSSQGNPYKDIGHRRIIRARRWKTLGIINVEQEEHNPCAQGSDNLMETFDCSPQAQRPFKCPKTAASTSNMNNEDTFCSVLDNEMPSARTSMKDPVKNHLLDSTAPTEPTQMSISTSQSTEHRLLSHMSVQSKLSDRTYCSAIGTEPFDLDAAIRRIHPLQAGLEASAAMFDTTVMNASQPAAELSSEIAETASTSQAQRPFKCPKTVACASNMNNEDTFCSVLDNEIQSARMSVKAPVKNRLLDSTAPTEPTQMSISTSQRTEHRLLSHMSVQSKLSDRTYCSAIDRDDEHTQRIAAEPFHLDAAIRRILPLQAGLNASAAMFDTTVINASSSSQPLVEPSSEIADTPSASQRSVYLGRIEEIVLTFLLDLINCGDNDFVTISVKRVDGMGCEFDTHSQTLSQMEPLMRRTRGRHKIMNMMKMLKDVYCKLSNGETCTKRELYYDDPVLSQDMDKIGANVRDVSQLIGALPWQLGLLSTSKGLMCGPVRITLDSDESIDCCGGILLPHLTTGIKSIETTAELVLLVEKDTVYEMLVRVDYAKYIGRSCILITGKGYPDTNTRVMLHKLWSLCRLPIYALCDADPHGIQIMLIYRHGSVAMSPWSDHMAVPAIKWIGVRPSDIRLLGLPTIAMSSHDKKRTQQMLRRPYVSEEMRQELQVLLSGERKTEIESLAVHSRSYLYDTYIPERLRAAMRVDGCQIESNETINFNVV